LDEQIKSQIESIDAEEKLALEFAFNIYSGYLDKEFVQSVQILASSLRDDSAKVLHPKAGIEAQKPEDVLPTVYYQRARHQFMESIASGEFFKSAYERAKADINAKYRARRESVKAKNSALAGAGVGSRPASKPQGFGALRP
jgi:DNA-binding SARP family transcriptional activator